MKISLKGLQILLYIISANSDQRDNPTQASVYRPSNQQIRDVFREVRQVDVGVHVGKSLRLGGKNYQRATTSCVGKGNAKRTHIRRGHWHLYWVGHKPNQKQILKWLQPMVIHPEAMDEGDIYATPVKDPAV